MKTRPLAYAALALTLFAFPAAAVQPPAALNFTMQTLDGKEMKLVDLAGKVVMFVNVASECGYTPQYTPMQEIYEKYKDQGFVLIGVPCNQFGGQEPGTAEEIREFCSTKYRVTFPLTEKVEVNGENACPLYQHLTALDVKPKGPGKVSWNFEKFLVNKKGEVIARWPSRVKPDAEEVIKRIEAALAAE